MCKWGVYKHKNEVKEDNLNAHKIISNWRSLM